MGVPLLTGLALAGALAGGDTTVAIQRGDRVVVEQAAGDLVVRTWARSELRATAGDVDDESVRVSRTGSQVRVSTEGRRGRRGTRDLTLVVPEWVEVDIRGRELDVNVSGVGGALSVSTIEGDVEIAGTRGGVTVRTVDGKISIADARGSVHARSEGDDVTLRDVVGDVEVETGSGDIVLDRLDSGRVRAETLDGDISFDGLIKSGGSYEFSVHDGDATLALPAGVGARVNISTFDGEFTSDFPVTVQRFSDARAFDFVLGDGTASIKVDVFDGEIRLVRRR